MIQHLHSDPMPQDLQEFFQALVHQARREGAGQGGRWRRQIQPRREEGEGAPAAARPREGARHRRVALLWRLVRE